MDANAKKTALRMIPYGLYVLMAETRDGRVAAATVNWVTQASFEPPLVVVGVKVGSSPHTIIPETKCFSLSILGKGQGPIAYAFFKPAQREGDRIGGEVVRAGKTGSPILVNAPAAVECEQGSRREGLLRRIGARSGQREAPRRGRCTPSALGH
jgi:flavin reductase (DIM6/NTAB) family NADH-FMN oxidoreductase RutF